MTDITIQTSVILDGASWIVEAKLVQIGDKEVSIDLPEFAVQAGSQEEAFTKAEEILRSAKITLRNSSEVSC